SGGEGADLLSGGQSGTGDNGPGDVLDGGPGSDVVRGRGGRDAVAGGPGNDHLEGNGQDDALDGGPGRDVMLPGTGRDAVSGGDGVDTVSYVDRTSGGVVLITLNGAADDGEAGELDALAADVENVVGSP